VGLVRALPAFVSSHQCALAQAAERAPSARKHKVVPHTLWQVLDGLQMVIISKRKLC